MPSIPSMIGFIVNVRAGYGKSLGILEQIRILNDANHDLVQYAVTEHAGHAIRLTQNFIREGMKILVSVGGDGTLSEVVNGYMLEDGLSQEVSIAIINVGTGGDFSRSLNIDPFVPANFNDFVEDLLQLNKNLDDDEYNRFSDVNSKFRYQRIDVGVVNCAAKLRYFLNVCSAGMSAKIASSVQSNRWSSSMFGSWSYWIHSAWINLVGLKQPLVRIQWSETESETVPLYMIAICNGKFFGGGIKISPDATPFDGKFHVCLLESMERLTLYFKLSRQIANGSHLDEKVPNIRQYECSRLELTPAETGMAPILVEADGEMVGKLPATFEILPNAVEFILQ